MRAIDLGSAQLAANFLPQFEREEMQRRLAALPSVALGDQRPRGWWVVQDETYTRFQCSRCKCKNFGQRWNYCPACGADMDLEAANGQN